MVGITPNQKSTTKTLAIVLVIMFVTFVLIRELWQKGGRPLAGMPGGDFVAIAILVIVLVIAWFIHKKTS
ncbi:MAG: hypothetical protein QXK88_10085 [Desulfurococcaceae archaeon]